MKLFTGLLLFLFTIMISACSRQESVDLLVYNARIYTVDSAFSIAEAMVIKNGKIIDIGDNKTITSRYESDSTLDAQGKFIYPGFIDAHAHFFRYGLGLQTANLVGTKSWEEILSILQQFEKDKQLEQGEWLKGRGWDQNNWPDKEFPTKEKLDELFPTRPVILTRIDGHAAIVNQAAINISMIQPGQKITGGAIITRNGNMTGVLLDNAIDLVASFIPEASNDQIAESLQQGQMNCFAVGLTTVDDCGISYRDALFMDSMHKKGILKMRVYAMLSDDSSNYAFLFRNGKIKTDHLNVRSFKVYGDGALGSRGACLLRPYSDSSSWHGFLLSEPSHFDSIAGMIAKNDMQMCTHAIGDSANRIILNTYAKYLVGKNNKRWRIEHAQVVHPDDFNLFGRYSIIPSVQPTHATSDMDWAEKRLGSERVKSAYAFKQLMNENGWIPLGTDFPVEDISPFKTFLAAVFRIDEYGNPLGGYQSENALKREEALKGMTIWAARSNFEENEKGSLEKGKLADFVMTDKDLMKVQANEILQINVMATYIGGRNVFRRPVQRELRINGE